METMLFIEGVMLIILVLEVELRTGILSDCLNSTGQTKGSCESFPFSEPRCCEGQSFRSKSLPADVL
jgi:hypothetical protein